MVLPARRGPITAAALPGTPGNRTVRRVKPGTGVAKASTIFCRIKSLIYPSNKDIIAYNCPYDKDKLASLGDYGSSRSSFPSQELSPRCFASTYVIRQVGCGRRRRVQLGLRRRLARRRRLGRRGRHMSFPETRPRGKGGQRV